MNINKLIKRTIPVTVVLLTLAFFAASSPADAQEERRQVPAGVFENLNLDIPIEIDGSLTIEGDIEPGGDVVGQGDLEVAGNVDGNIDIEGDISIGGSIEPGASIFLTTPGTTLDVEAGMNGGSVEVTAGDVYIDIGENVEGGNISMVGENSRVSIDGSVGRDSRIDGEPSVDVSKNVSGEIEVSDEISVGENVENGGELISGENISIGEDLQENGSATLEAPGKTLEIDRTMKGEATVTENAKIVVGEVPVEIPVEVSVDASPLDGVEISVINEVADLGIEISNLGGDVDVDIERTEDAVYNYQEIKVETGGETLPEEEIDKARLNANVEKSWLEEQGIDAEDVRVNRYHDGEWIELPTEIVDENATHILIEAETPGFSSFSITGEPEDRERIPEGVFENRHLNRPVEIDGDLIIEGDIGPEGDITGEGNLEVGENVNGIVNITGSIEIGGNVGPEANISVTGNISIDGSISPGATLSLETPGTTLNVEAGMKGGTIEVSAGDVEINVGENFESGYISLTGEDSRVNIDGSTGVESVIEGLPTVNVGRNVSGEIDVSRSVSVGESVSGEVISQENIFIGQDLREEGSATLETPGKTLEIQRTLEGDATVTENANVSIGEVPEDVPVDVSVEASPLDGVNISVEHDITDLDIEISNLRGDVDVDIDPPENTVYNYQEIEVTATEDEIEEATLTANVEKSWLEERGIDEDTVRINRYVDGQWEELETRIVRDTATHIQIESETPGFSTFSITGEEEPVEIPDEELPWMLIVGIVIVIAIVAAAGALTLRK